MASSSGYYSYMVISRNSTYSDMPKHSGTCGLHYGTLTSGMLKELLVQSGN